MPRHLPERISRKLGIRKGFARKHDVTILKLDPDELRQNAEGLSAVVSQISGIPFYEGHVEHGYSMADVPTTRKCPRCHAPTQQYNANWVYATQVAPRVMFAPAGYFCTKCPTVIIDEGMIQAGVTRGFQFRGILALDYEGREEIDSFRTWNGKETIYIFDENETAMGLSTLDSTRSLSLRRTKHTPRSRKRAARQFGKRKRRRKKR